MKKGTIVELTDRDSGFIKLQNGKDNLFFHADQLEGVTFKSLRKGDELTFSVVETTKGPYAIQVKLVKVEKKG